MGSNNYYVENNNGGIVGGHDNVINYTIRTGQFIFENSEEDANNLTKGTHLLLSLEIFNKYVEPLTQEIDERLSMGGFPLKIKITNLVEDCANGVYYNGGNNDREVEKLVNGLFTLICTSRSFFYLAKIVRVGNNYFFEMYPNDYNY